MDHLHEVPGFGIQGIWNGQTARLGRAAWVGANAPERTATTLKIGDEPAITLTFHDDMRAGAADLVTALKAQGKHVILISGDTEASVHHFAKRIGIDTVFANALPHEKADKLTDIAAKGGTALMVGDGLNDTAALAAAHVSISPASALAAARAASDMVLMGQSLAPIADAITTSQSAKRRIQENFSIATMYNILAVPFAIAGLCSPLIAALAMSSSSITVSLNALRLK
jgi:Cu2+-exporting ATPase